MEAEEPRKIQIGREKKKKRGRDINECMLGDAVLERGVMLLALQGREWPLKRLTEKND